MLTITPRSPSGPGSLAAMASAARRVTLKVPTRLTWTTVANRSSECGPWRPRTRSAGAIPAQLTAACRPPPSTAAATASRTLASSVTSVATNRARSPSSAATRSPRSRSTSARTTDPPRSTTIRAVAAPSPDPPPVTSTVLPVMSTPAPPLGRGGTLRQPRRAPPVAPRPARLGPLSLWTTRPWLFLWTFSRKSEVRNGEQPRSLPPHRAARAPGRPAQPQELPLGLRRRLLPRSRPTGQATRPTPPWSSGP